MEIIDYDNKYDEQIKDLIVELQNYLIDIDDWHTQILSNNYREDYFEMDLELINKQDGKIFLAIENNKIVGLVLGAVNLNDEIDKLTNDCAKTGAILELVVRNDARGQGVGKNLLEKMEEYFKEVGCKGILLNIFTNNKIEKKFYEKEGYSERTSELIKQI